MGHKFKRCNCNVRYRKVINKILFILFLSFALVQLNDSDSLIWFLIYGIVALISIVANYKKVSRILIVSLIVVFCVYAVMHFGHFVDWLKVENKNDIFGDMVYEKPYLEGTREFLGLIIAILALLYHLKQPTEV